MEKLRKKSAGRDDKKSHLGNIQQNYNLIHHCYSGKNNLCNNGLIGKYDNGKFGIVWESKDNFCKSK